MFLSCIQVFQETDKMVWYSHFFKNFPKFVIIHTVKGFSIVDETEVDAFLESPCFLCDPENVCNLNSGSSAFSKPSWNIWKFLVHIMLKLSMQDLSMTLLASEMSANVQWFEYSLVLPFLGIGMRIILFQACGHCWVFQIC